MEELKNLDAGQATLAHGTTLEYSEDGSTWIKLSNLITVTPPTVATDEIETTDHDSNGWKKFISGLKDGGSMPFKCNVANEENIMKLYELALNGKVVNWRITTPPAPENSLVVELNGFVKVFNLDELVSGNALTATGEIRNSGQPTFGFKKVV